MLPGLIDDGRGELLAVSADPWGLTTLKIGARSVGTHRL